MINGSDADLATNVARNLPFLRRYARAITGSQVSGDRYAAAAIEAVLVSSEDLVAAGSAKLGLFKTFHRVWATAGAPLGSGDSTLSAAAQAHMSRLTPNTREALLLHTIEGFNFADIGTIIGVTAEEANQLVDRAVAEMQDSILGSVLIIEDEAIIALDISAIVEGMSHTITGIARTRSEAVEMALARRPDLVLADIQLADNSSGIDAVTDILTHFPDVPAIFITAFPERLLTGERPEPAFMINKPYTEEQVRSAVSQAMFFASTETLNA